MNLTLTIQDSAGSRIMNNISVSFEHDHVTLKDIIEARVIKEVNEYNNKRPEYFNGLVQPLDAEKTLNGYKLKENRKTIDPEKQVYIALNAFQNNGFFVLIDNKQVDSLEQEIILKPTTTIKFVKLTQLVGG